MNLFLDNPALASVDVKNGRVYPVECLAGLYARCPHGLTVRCSGEDADEMFLKLTCNGIRMKAPAELQESDAPASGNPFASLHSKAENRITAKLERHRNKNEFKEATYSTGCQPSMPASAAGRRLGPSAFVLYAVTVGSAELSGGGGLRVILYELFRWGDPGAAQPGRHGGKARY